MSHARLSPSSASRWTKCPGSLNLITERKIQDKSGISAEEGTAAHELLEKCLLESKHPSAYLGQFFNPCTIQPKGFEVDQDMVDHIETVYDWVMLQTEVEGAAMYAERKVFPGKLFGRDDCKGTADVTLIAPPVITIADLKYGKGVVVEVANNLQFILYGLGVLADLTPEQMRKIKFVDMVALQPRAFHKDGPIRKMRYTVADMFAWAEWFRKAAIATDDPNAPLVAGKSQCQFCPVKRSRLSCPALRDKSMEAFEVKNVAQLQAKVLRDPRSLSQEERRLIIDSADIITDFIKSVKATAQEDLMNGVPVPGQKLVRGKGGIRKWLDEDKVEQHLTRNLGVKKNELFADPKLLGVEKILKLAKKAPKMTDAKLEKLNTLIDKPKGKLVMAPESDERQSIGSERALDAFKDIVIPTKETGV